MVQIDEGGIRCEGIEKVTECPDGKIPILSPANYEIWSLFQMMLPGLIRKDGYDYMAVKVVFDMNGIDQGRRPTMFAQIKSLVDIVETERRKRTE